MWLPRTQRKALIVCVVVLLLELPYHPLFFPTLILSTVVRAVIHWSSDDTVWQKGFTPPESIYSTLERTAASYVHAIFKYLKISQGLEKLASQSQSLNFGPSYKNAPYALKSCIHVDADFLLLHIFWNSERFMPWFRLAPRSQWCLHGDLVTALTFLLFQAYCRGSLPPGAMTPGNQAMKGILPYLNPCSVMIILILLQTNICSSEYRKRWKLSSSVWFF